MGLAAAVVGGAALTAVGGIAAGSMESSAAKSAASTQASAENQAAQTQQNMYNQTAANLAPYNQAGQQATSNIQNMSPFNFNPTEAQLEATPGYQFNLDQGLKSTQNSYAAQGLGSSGAALKGAATYASGLADTTYQNQFANALSTYNTNLGVQQGLAQLGEGAAAQTGSFGTTTAANIGATQVGAGNAQAAGTVGSAQAAGSAINNATSSIGSGLTSAYLYGNLFGSNGNTASMYAPSSSVNSATPYTQGTDGSINY